MKDEIIAALAKVTNQDPATFSENTVIKDIPGFDSLQYVMMISDLQESRHIEIPLDKAIEAETIGQLAEFAVRIS